MKNQKMHIYYDKEGDYLEIRFGEPAESYYEKVAPDTFVRIDEKTRGIIGYAIFNLQKGGSTPKAVDFEIPLSSIFSLNRN